MKRSLGSLATIALLTGAISATSVFAAEKSKKQTSIMDYGPFLTASYVCDPRAGFDNGPGSFTGDSVARGIAIKLADNWDAGIVFDADLMRVAEGWTDGAAAGNGSGLKMRGLIGDGAHGWNPSPTVAPVFQTPHLPGWANKAGSFADPRPDKIAPLPPAGALPKDQAHYNGLYRHGEKVVLSYTINGAPILESFSLESAGDAKAFVRTIRIEKSDGPLSLMLADSNPQYPYPGAQKITNIEKKPDGYKPAAQVQGTSATLDDVHAALIGAPDGAKLEVINGSQLVARLPQVQQPVTLKILIAGGGEKSAGAFANIVKLTPKAEDLVAMTKGGPSLWKGKIETKGELAKDDKKAAYVVDRLGLPENNPYHARMRIGGFDFFPGATSAALSTWDGDVWIVTGIDDSLEHLKWHRFATGLFQPLGLKIVGNDIYTVGHDQLTLLKDLDGDGEADFYQNFNNNWQLTTAFHAFAFDLQTDPEGNFYFAFGSPVHAGGGGFQKITADHGSLMKVSKDGSKIEHYARGLRAPNGMCVGPHGEVTCGDNEGSWVPSSPLHWVKPGQFLGVAESSDVALKSTVAKPDPSEAPKPLLWLSHNGGIDNSSGGQVWVTSDKWGPFQGDLLCMSYGQSRLFHVMKEEINGQMQGGATAFPLKFTSSCMRGRFSTRDGQLYITGLRGWQTNAAKEGGFDRVRYTGAPVEMPKDLHVLNNGVSITFTTALDPKSASDPANYDVEVWNYKWTGGYGSPEVSTMPDDASKGKTVTAKGKKSNQHDQLEVKSAKLQPDGKTVVLEIAGIKPVMQMKISYNIDTKDKPGLKGDIFNTIHNLGAGPVAAK